MGSYRVLKGLNYGPKGATRREPGDVVDDLPDKSIAWLLEQGCVEAIEPAPTADQPAVPAPSDGGHARVRRTSPRED